MTSNTCYKYFQIHAQKRVLFRGLFRPLHFMHYTSDMIPQNQAIERVFARNLEGFVLSSMGCRLGSGD